jgi:hypothetical protein
VPETDREFNLVLDVGRAQPWKRNLDCGGDRGLEVGFCLIPWDFPGHATSDV